MRPYTRSLSSTPFKHNRLNLLEQFPRRPSTRATLARCELYPICDVSAQELLCAIKQILAIFKKITYYNYL